MEGFTQAINTRVQVEDEYTIMTTREVTTLSKLVQFKEEELAAMTTSTREKHNAGHVVLKAVLLTEGEVFQEIVQIFSRFLGARVECRIMYNVSEYGAMNGKVAMMLEEVVEDQQADAGLLNDGFSARSGSKTGSKRDKKEDGKEHKEKKSKARRSDKGIEVIEVEDLVEETLLHHGTVDNNQSEDKPEDRQIIEQTSDNNHQQQHLSSLLSCMTSLMPKEMSEKDKEELGKRNSECEESDRDVAHRKNKLSQQKQKQEELERDLDKQKNLVFNEQQALEQAQRRNNSLKRRREVEQEKQETEAKQRKLFETMIGACEQLQALQQRQQGGTD